MSRVEFSNPLRSHCLSWKAEGLRRVQIAPLGPCPLLSRKFPRFLSQWLQEMIMNGSIRHSLSSVTWEGLSVTGRPHSRGKPIRNRSGQRNRMPALP